MSLGHQRWIDVEFALEEFPKESRLQLETALIGHKVPKDEMLELGILALFILQEEAPAGICGKPMSPPELYVKIFLLNDAFIDAGQHGKVHDSTIGIDASICSGCW
jgi:hypothetical protein